MSDPYDRLPVNLGFQFKNFSDSLVSISEQLVAVIDKNNELRKKILDLESGDRFLGDASFLVRRMAKAERKARQMEDERDDNIAIVKMKEAEIKILDDTIVSLKEELDRVLKITIDGIKDCNNE